MAEHPEWWIRHLEVLEALDEPGGARFGGDSGLEMAVVDSLARRGCVLTTAALLVDAKGKPEASVPWAILTDLGRQVFEEDLPPPPFVHREWPSPLEEHATAPDDPSTERTAAAERP
jgi:hypothetical protein